VIVGVASGKGGTGKTTVAVNLALILAEDRDTTLLDCDVEGPNCHIFLQTETRSRETVGIPGPVVDDVRCTACGACSQICRYHAIVSLKGRPLLFPELCHGCGGCMLVCPVEAIQEVSFETGTVETGVCGRLTLVQGRLDVGHPMAPPVIRAVRKHAPRDGLTLIDSPPGTACPVVAALRGVDCVVLVAEPTPFGLHDLGMAVETVRLLGLPLGVVVNRADAGDSRVLEACAERGVPVLAEIPEDRRIAEASSRGIPLLTALPEFRPLFADMWQRIVDLAQGGRAES